MWNATRHAAAALAALVLSSGLAIGVAPIASAADEPIPPAPPTALEVCEAQRESLQGRVAFWEAQASSFEELLRASQQQADLASDQWIWWQNKAVSQNVEVLEMKETVDRVRERLARQRATVKRLRKELADRT